MLRFSPGPSWAAARARNGRTCGLRRPCGAHARELRARQPSAAIARGTGYTGASRGGVQRSWGLGKNPATWSTCRSALRTSQLLADARRTASRRDVTVQSVRRRSRPKGPSPPPRSPPPPGRCFRGANTLPTARQARRPLGTAAAGVPLTGADVGGRACLVDIFFAASRARWAKGSVGAP